MERVGALYFPDCWEVRIQIRPDNQLSVLPKYFRLEKQMLKEIFSVGLSAMLLDILLIISSLMFNYYALKYGDYVLAGFGISQKLVQVVDLIGMGLYMGVIPLIAVAYGAGNELRIVQFWKHCSRIWKFGIIFKSFLLCINE